MREINDTPRSALPPLPRPRAAAAAPARGRRCRCHHCHCLSADCRSTEIGLKVRSASPPNISRVSRPEACLIYWVAWIDAVELSRSSAHKREDLESIFAKRSHAMLEDGSIIVVILAIDGHRCVVWCYPYFGRKFFQQIDISGTNLFKQWNPVGQVSLWWK